MCLVQDIQKLLLKIETEFPELYAYLDEDPIALKGSLANTVTSNDLKDYLELLKQKLEHYKENYNKIS
ncbi:hypothetical protein [Fulvivirga sp.]|uniref:hypothetical protein n=1 Tax=Fulvivirga sp. TaxID=1931237 RepID=UPI0032F04F1A